MLKHITFIALLFGGIYYYWITRPVTHGPGEVAPHHPRQTMSYDNQSFEYKSFNLTPVANFKAEVRLLSKKKYLHDKQAELAPYDFVIGWGPMSDERNLDHILIKQADRSFYWEMTKPPIPQPEMMKHTANLRIVPPNKEVSDKLENVRIGQVIKINGTLVNVSSSYGWNVKTSTVRTDIGDDATEIVWLKDFQVINKHSL